MHTKKYIRALAILIVGVFFFFANKGRAEVNIDSLESLIPQKTGMVKMSLLQKVSYYYRHRAPERAIALGRRAIKYANLVNNENYRFTAYSTISLAFRYNMDLDSAMYYANKAMEIANNTGDTLQNYIVNNRLGIIYRMMGRPMTSISFYTRAISYATSARSLGDLYNNIGNSYRRTGDYSKALDYFNKTLKIRKETHDDLNLSYILNNISNLYQDMGQIRRAYTTIKQSLEIKKKFNNPYDLSISYSNLAKIYLSINDSSMDSAYYSLQKAIYYANTANNPELQILNSSVLAEYYQKKGEYIRSNAILDSVLMFYIAKNMEENTSTTLLKMVKNYISEHNYFEARKKLHFIKVIAEEHNLIPILQQYYSRSAELYSLTGSYKKALSDLQEYNKIDKELFSNDIQNKLTDIEVKRQIENQEKNNQILAQQNQLQKVQLDKQRLINYFAVFIILMFLLVLFFRYRSHKKLKHRNKVLVQVKNQLEESETKLLAANNIKNKLFSLITHDILSGFSPVYGMVELLNNSLDKMSKEEVKEYIQNIYDGATRNLQLMKNILSWGKSQLDSFEIKFEKINLNSAVRESMQVLTLLAENKNILIINNVPLSFFVKSDKEILSSIFRNLLTNAIKFSHSGDRIMISAKRIGNEIKVCVKDQGIGMPQEKIRQLLTGTEIKTEEGTGHEKGNGLGMIITKDFVEKNNGVLSIESEVGQGTIVCFTVQNI
jgi:signal transduction histidine kinase